MELDYTKLCKLLGAPKFTGTSNNEAAAMVNADDILAPYSRRVTIRDMIRELGATKSAELLQAIHAIPDPSGLIAAVLAMLGDYSDGGGVDVGHLEARRILDGWVKLRYLSEDQVAAVKGMAERKVSLADLNQLPPIDPAHVGSARKMMKEETP